MSVLEVIYGRRSVRKYQDRPIPRETIGTLIRAAVQAPSAMNLQPWTFFVVDDRQQLKAYSDRAKTYLLETLDPKAPSGQLRDLLGDPGYNIFYSAPALIVVASKSKSEWITEDCCLAGGTLMLAAVEMGLGTCVIGFARPWLRLPEVRHELGLPAEWSPVLPIIVGFPEEIPAAVKRADPEIRYVK